MSQVLDAMFEKFCTEGEHIIDQDDDGDNFYVIEWWLFLDFSCVFRSLVSAHLRHVVIIFPHFLFIQRDL